jgi:RimJ/RimL family protein N-acetyltransferase
MRKIGNRLNVLVGIGVEATLFYEFVAGDLIPDVPVTAGVTVLRVPPERSATMLRQAPGRELKLWQERLQAGDICYTAFLDGRLAHHSWVKRAGIQPVPEAARNYTVAPGEFWIYHCWTAAWARGKRIYPSVLAWIIREHINEGFTRARIYTTTSNIASQHGIARAGFRLRYTLRAIRFGAFRLKLAS